MDPATAPRESIGVIGTGYVGLVTAAGCSCAPTSARRSNKRGSSSLPSERRPTPSGDADLSAAHAVFDALPASEVTLWS
jgi:hypothetical protein